MYERRKAAALDLEKYADRWQHLRPPMYWHVRTPEWFLI
jgi:hypothetical protein